jgi:hypothetical protein
MWSLLCLSVTVLLPLLVLIAVLAEIGLSTFIMSLLVITTIAVGTIFLLCPPGESLFSYTPHLSSSRCPSRKKSLDGSTYDSPFILSWVKKKVENYKRRPNAQRKVSDDTVVNESLVLVTGIRNHKVRWYYSESNEMLDQASDHEWISLRPLGLSSCLTTLPQPEPSGDNWNLLVAIIEMGIGEAIVGYSKTIVDVRSKLVSGKTVDFGIIELDRPIKGVRLGQKKRLNLLCNDWHQIRGKIVSS